jgi:hypothetical protein
MICILVSLSLTKERTQAKPSDVQDVVGLLSYLLWAAVTIWMWQKYVKEYVAFAVEQKWAEMSRDPEG